MVAEHWSRKLCLFPVTPGAWNTVTHILFAQKVKVAHLRPGPILCDHMDYTVHGILQARMLEWVALPFSRGTSQTRGIEPGSPTMQADSLPAEPPGKPSTFAQRWQVFLHLADWQERLGSEGWSQPLADCVTRPNSLLP